MVVTNQSHWFFLPPKTKQQNIDLFYNKYNNITNKLQTQSKKGKHKKRRGIDVSLMVRKKDTWQVSFFLHYDKDSI